MYQQENALSLQVTPARVVKQLPGKCFLS